MQFDWIVGCLESQAQLYRLAKYLARSRTMLVPGAGFRTAVRSYSGAHACTDKLSCTCFLRVHGKTRKLLVDAEILPSV